MSRESRLGYGFLFVGVGAPFLIYEIFKAPLTATIVSCFFVVSGVALLIDGHLRGDSHAPLRSKMGTVLVFILWGAGIGALTGALSGIIWIAIRPLQRATLETAAKNQPIAAPATPNGAGVVSLHDLYLGDCKGSQVRSTYALTGETAGKPITYSIEFMLCPDFAAKSLYLSFFLPKSDHTLAAMQYLPTLRRQILDDPKHRTLFPNIVHQKPGERAETWAELAPSSRVFVYHETTLLPERIEALVTAYEAEGIAPQFRSRDYEIMRNSPLYPRD